MKGLTLGVEFLAKLLIVIFIIVVIVILLVNFLPSSIEVVCKQRQYDSIINLINVATSTTASEVYREFRVEECVEKINFDCVERSGDKDMKCYEITFKGKDPVKVSLGIDANILEINGGDNLRSIDSKSTDYQAKISAYSIIFPSQTIDS